MSDEKFSSCPPSFPIAITTKLVGAPLTGARRSDLTGQRGVAEGHRLVEADVGERRQLARHLLRRPPAELARPEAQDLGRGAPAAAAAEDQRNRAAPAVAVRTSSAMTSGGFGRRR